MRKLFSVAAVICALATLAPGGVAPSAALPRGFELLCSLYLDPHDAFTRVVDPSEPALRNSARANATLSNIVVNYTGFSAEAQAAFREATNIWLTQLSSTVPIVVDAEFRDLGNPLLLGHAGFRSLDFNFPGAPLAEVLYPGPIANRLSGIDRNGATTEILVLLNSSGKLTRIADAKRIRTWMESRRRVAAI